MTTLTATHVAALAQAAGFRGEALVIAVAIAKAESGFDPKQVFINSDQWRSRDRGLWQINSHWHPEVKDAQAFDPAGSAMAAYNISVGGKSWSPWSTYDPDPDHPDNNSAYRKFLKLAASAVKKVSGQDPNGKLASGGSSTGSPVGHLPPESGTPLDVRIGGQYAVTQLGYALLSAPVSFTTEEASQLTLTFEDNDHLILRRFKLASGPDGTLVECGGRWRIFSVASQPGPKGPQTVLVCQPSGVMRMRSFVPDRVRNMSPTEYMQLICNAVGLDFFGEPTATQPSIGPHKTRDAVTKQQRLENAWEVGRRLADAHKLLAYESGGTYHFGTAQYVSELAMSWQVIPPGGESEGPDFGMPVDSWGWPTITDLAFGSTRPKRTMSMRLPRADLGTSVRAGDEVWIAGIPGLGGRVTATVTNVGFDVMRALDPVEVQALDRSYWDDRDLNRADKAAGGTALVSAGTDASAGSAATRGGKSALDFVTLCLQQIGDSYQLGDGRNINDRDPDSFDCSGLVYWACAQVGITIPGTSQTQYYHCRDHHTLIPIDRALHTRGALLFEAGSDGTPDSPGHVAVSLGNGTHTIEARGTAYGVNRQPTAGRPWSHGARIPGMRYR